MNYSFQEGVKLAILTNGITWWFYLPLHEGSWEQRRFYTIDVHEQETEEVVSKFIDFLSKENMANGTAIQNAEEVYTSYKKETIIKDTLSKAWNKVISDVGEAFIELISETTEKICGYRPDNEIVERFISRNRDQLLIHITPPLGGGQGRGPKRPRKPVSTPTGYTGKFVSGFYFKGIRREAGSWKDLLMQVIGVIRELHRADFEKVLTLEGRKRPYFTHNKNLLRAPEKIPNTNIFVETNLSANFIVKICFHLLAIFSYSDNDLKIDFH